LALILVTLSTGFHVTSMAMAGPNTPTAKNQNKAAECELRAVIATTVRVPQSPHRSSLNTACSDAPQHNCETHVKAQTDYNIPFLSRNGSLIRKQISRCLDLPDNQLANHEGITDGRTTPTGRCERLDRIPIRSTYDLGRGVRQLKRRRQSSLRQNLAQQLSVLPSRRL
jgi:hypothetical protein